MMADTLSLTHDELASFAKAYDISHNAFIVLDKNLTVLHINNYALTMYSLAEAHLWQGQSINTLWDYLHFPPLFDDKHPLMDTQLVRTNTIQRTWQITSITVDNEKAWLLIDKEQDKAERLYNTLAHEIGIITGQNLEQYQTVHEYINVLHHFFTFIINHIPCYVYWKNQQLEYIGCNFMAAEFFNLENPKDIIGKTDFDLFSDKELAESYRQVDSAILAEGKPIHKLSQELRRANGEIYHTLVSKVPIINEADTIVGVLGITIDVTKEKQAELAKTEFIANMSHDIRTPLTGLIGLSELLEHTLKTPQDKEKAHLLHDSGEELLNMLNEILDDVRSERLDKNEVEHECFNLHETIHDLVRLESPATHLKGLQLNAKIAPNVPQYIISDHNKIQRVLLNLMGNSIKFTQSGSITLAVETIHTDSSKVHLKFSVSDTGIGIPEEVQSKVFNRFFKVSSSYKGIYTGHGLGLHIVQTYVNLLGGHITLTSTLGEGSTFNFDLECDIGEAPDEVEEVQSVTLNTTPHQLYHLLLIEDNLVALKSLEALLTARGYTFASAMNAEDGLLLLSSQSFDLIISDIGLPGLSGMEFAQQVRTEEQAQNKPPIPIIGLTGHAKEAAEQECRSAGMNEVFSKPAPMEDLDRCIQRLMNKTTPSSSEVKAKPVSSSPLGIDLPQTEAALFQLEHYPLFDEAYALSQIPDKNILATLMSSYCSEDIQKDIHQMEQAYQDTNWEQVENLAHKFKGGVAYLGAERMKFACQYLERYYKAGHRTLLEPLYQQLLRVNQDTLAEVTHWLQNNQ